MNVWMVQQSGRRVERVFSTRQKALDYVMEEYPYSSLLDEDEGLIIFDTELNFSIHIFYMNVD